MKIKDKWDNLDRGIQKWATRLGAIATITGIIVGACAWLIHQVDNAVATRIENQTEALQQEVQKLSDSVKEHQEQSELRLMRLELMNLMSLDENNIIEIERVAREYFSRGGNSYMTGMYTRWCRSHSADCEIVFR